ncbi:DUF6631 family protein [Lysobacter sp. CA199]|uniref:DUF6631 family protein n=1 Tax=Lysobacter sp. CA199 TaxID=3455608 RepID=UPI003F8D2171
MPKTSAAPKKGAAETELEILHPDREVVIADQTFVLREYGFAEGLLVRAMAKPFLMDLYAMYAEPGRAPTFAEIADLIDAHGELVIQLIARSANVSVETLNALTDADGELVAVNWWLANSGFFTRWVMRRLVANRPAGPSGGPASTTPSSAPATDAALRNSDASPSAS